MSAADNRWRIEKNAILDWTGQPPLRADSPRELLEWTLSIIELGESTQVARFRREDGTYWTRAELTEYLERGLAERSVVDAFGFSSRYDRIGSKIAYHDEDGVREGLIDDMGALLERFHGEDGYPGHIRRLPPLMLGGHAISFEPDAHMSAHKLPSSSVSLKLMSDIWFPWVPWFGLREGERFHDNRALAERHTPRLNRFISGLRQSVLDRGGRWDIFVESESWYGAQLGPDGIDLSAPPPLKQSTLGPWPGRP